MNACLLYSSCFYSIFPYSYTLFVNNKEIDYFHYHIEIQGKLKRATTLGFTTSMKNISQIFCKIKTKSMTKQLLSSRPTCLNMAVWYCYSLLTEVYYKNKMVNRNRFHRLFCVGVNLISNFLLVFIRSFFWIWIS